MQPARGGGIADRFADGHGEGDDVVLHAGFELMDLRDIDFGASANRGSGILRDLARFGQGLRGCKLDFQPLGELVRVGSIPSPKSRNEVPTRVSRFHDTAIGEALAGR